MTFISVHYGISMKGKGVNDNWKKKKGSSWADNDCIFSVTLHERGPSVNFRRKFGDDVLNVKTM